MTKPSPRRSSVHALPLSHAWERDVHTTRARWVRAGSRRLASAITTLLLAAIPATAFAGNDDEILIGTQGARLGGAVTATVTDSTALWYNPGAIGRTRWAQFGVSGTLVQLRHTSTKLPTLPDGTDVRDLELTVVPSTLGHEIPLPGNWAFGYGVFTSQAQDRTLSYTSGESESTFQRKTSNFGAGLGAPLASTLRIGLGMFAVYEYTDRFNVISNAPTPTITASHREALSSFASLGLHWAPTQDWNLGLSINSPRILLVGTVEDSDRKLDGNLTATAPVRVRAGIAHDFGRLVLSLDGDIQAPLENDDALVDRRMVPNARLGADYELDEQTHLGLGFFTDLGPEKSSDQRMDFFGVAGGIETATRYKLDPNEPAESIEISAFIGFRYAFGTGHIDNANATAHEIGINLGSGLRF